MVVEVEEAKVEMIAANETVARIAVLALRR